MSGALQQHSVWTGYLSGTTGEVAKGSCMMLDTNGVYVLVATAANRTAASRTTCIAGIALNNADDDNTAVEIQTVGPCPPSVTGLGAGTATNLIVNSSGILERKTSPASTDIVVGKCDADGWAYLNFSARLASETIDTTNSSVSQESVEVYTEDDAPVTAGTEFELPTDSIVTVDVQVSAIQDGASVARIFNIRRHLLNTADSITAATQTDLVGPEDVGGTLDVSVTIQYSEEGDTPVAWIELEGILAGVTWRVDRQVVTVTATA